MVIKLENISKKYGTKEIFIDTSVLISENEVVGIIGKNGVGKSTLLNIIANKENIEHGIYNNPQGEISYLNQNISLVDNNTTIIEYIYKFLKYEYIQEYEIISLLNKFKIIDITEKFNNLSGSEKRKISLTIRLLEKSNILILDEPTNHLDIEMICWLEKYIIKQKKTIIIVSHDRYFLDAVCNSIIDIDQQKLYKYNGNFSLAMIKRKQRIVEYLAENRKNTQIFKKEQLWINQGAKARETKSKHRVDAFSKLENTEKYTSDKKINFKEFFRRIGNSTIELKNISFSRGEKKLISNFSYTFQKNERIGIIGENGVGKSTFLDLIAGEINADNGSITIGETLLISYFKQENIVLNDEIKVNDYIRDFLQSDTNFSVMNILEQFLFPPQVQHNYIKSLSGGEKRRLYLLSLLLQKPNVLILDEPTNDFDIITLEFLEELLLNFNGIIIFVSHDRYFLDKIGTKYLKLTGNGNIDIYNDFTINLFVDENIKKEKKHNSIKKMSFNEQFEFENIDSNINKVEYKLKELDKLMIEKANNYNELNKLINERKILEDEYQYLLTRWEYLYQLNENIIKKKEIN